jgi:hypothetical protein
MYDATHYGNTQVIGVSKRGKIIGASRAITVVSRFLSIVHVGSARSICFAAKYTAGATHYGNASCKAHFIRGGTL